MDSVWIESWYKDNTSRKGKLDFMRGPGSSTIANSLVMFSCIKKIGNEIDQVV